MERHQRASNVIVVADEVTASFYATAGIKFISADLFEDELIVEFLDSFGCELLLVTEEYWEKVRRLAKIDRFPPVVLIPSFKSGSTDSLPALKELSERAVGISFIEEEEEDND
jgi:vacuolar-type H+-ATPase subunit F/Vma7